MAIFLYGMDCQGISLVVFNIYDRIFVFVNTSTLIPCKRLSDGAKEMAITLRLLIFFYTCHWLNLEGSVDCVHMLS